MKFTILFSIVCILALRNVSFDIRFDRFFLTHLNYLAGKSIALFLRRNGSHSAEATVRASYSPAYDHLQNGYPATSVDTGPDSLQLQQCYREARVAEQTAPGLPSSTIIGSAIVLSSPQWRSGGSPTTSAASASMPATGSTSN